MASEYGWAKDYILEHVYIDELIKLSLKISVRKAGEYKMQLLIATNPHLTKPAERKLLWDALDKSIDNTIEKEDDKLDRAGLLALKDKLSRNSRWISVK